MVGQVDAIMAVGGDGTMLRVVRALEGRDVPVIGLNIGALGFLTSVAEKDLDRAFECLRDDKYEVSLRAIVECELFRGGARLAAYRGLNEVVVSSVSSRIVDLELEIDGAHVTSYACDDLIIATPTGSTGHSLSAGGPILSPETGALLISLICPHTLSSRPLVIPDSSTIRVTVVEAGEKVLLSVDGQVGQPMEAGDRVVVRRSGQGVRFLHLPGHSFFAVLRQKLHWSGSSV